MPKSRAIAGLAAIFLAAAAHADPAGSLMISNETRAILGGDIVDFADHNIVNQPSLPVISEADCGLDGMVHASFARQFSHSVWSVIDACHYFSEANWKSAIGRYEYSKTNLNENAIFMLDLAQTAQDLPKIMGLQEMKEKLDLPGTAKDWNALFFFHELQHSRDHINSTRNEETTEYYADLGANGYYQQAYRQGLVSNPRVPEAMRALRIFIIIKTRDDDAHNIAIFAGLPGMSPSDVLTPAHMSQSLAKANTALYRKIAPSRPAAEKMADKNPNLLYQAARKLYLTGAFDSDPVQKAYVGEFIRAAETFGARYYGTGDTHTFTKPSILSFRRSEALFD